MTNLPATLEYSLQSHDWLDTFREWLKTFRSPRTIETYIQQWSQFWKVAPLLEDAPKSIEQITTSHISDYRELRMKEYGWQPTTANLTMSAMSSFFKYCMKLNLLDENPCENIKQMPVNQYGKANFLTEDEIRRVITAARERVGQADTEEEERRALRLVAILLLFLGTGVRLNVMAKLRWGSFQRGRGGWRMNYTVKGGKQASKPVPDVAQTALQAYLRKEGERRGVTQEHAPIWVHSRNQKRYTAISDRHIEKIIRDHISTVLEPGHGISAHSLRHSAAQLLIDKEKPITHINRLLDHQSMKTTHIYIHATSQHGDLAVTALDEILGNM